MSGTARVGHLRALLRTLAVVGLLAGLIGMHHLSISDSPSGGAGLGSIAGPAAMSIEHGAGTPVAPAPSDDHGSAVLHLCLAVLTAVAVLVLGWLLWRRPAGGPARVVRRVDRARSAPRAPPCRASARLALLCVSRT